jgi:hypothetical protein
MMRRVVASVLAALFLLAPLNRVNAQVVTFGYVGDNSMIILSGVHFTTEARAREKASEASVARLMEGIDSFQPQRTMRLAVPGAERVEAVAGILTDDNGIGFDGVFAVAQRDDYVVVALAAQPDKRVLADLMAEALRTQVMPPAPEGYTREQLDIRHEAVKL